MTTHMPGPWVAERKQPGRWIIYQDHSERCPIASILEVNDSVDANARLIAATPDLLEALHDLLVLIETDSLIPESVSYMRQARAAIAKATGV